MPDLRQRDQLNILSGITLALHVVLADFIGDRSVRSAMNNLLGGGNLLIRRRSFAIALRNFAWRTAEKFDHRVIAQVQLVRAMEIEHASE